MSRWTPSSPLAQKRDARAACLPDHDDGHIRLTKRLHPFPIIDSPKFRAMMHPLPPRPSPASLTSSRDMRGTASPCLGHQSPSNDLIPVQDATYSAGRGAIIGRISFDVALSTFDFRAEDAEGLGVVPLMQQTHLQLEGRTLVMHNVPNHWCTDTIHMWLRVRIGEDPELVQVVPPRPTERLARAVLVFAAVEHARQAFTLPSVSEVSDLFVVYWRPHSGLKITSGAPPDPADSVTPEPLTPTEPSSSPRPKRRHCGTSTAHMKLENMWTTDMDISNEYRYSPASNALGSNLGKFGPLESPTLTPLSTNPPSTSRTTGSAQQSNGKLGRAVTKAQTFTLAAEEFLKQIMTEGPAQIAPVSGAATTKPLLPLPQSNLTLEDVVTYQSSPADYLDQLSRVMKMYLSLATNASSSTERAEIMPLLRMLQNESRLLLSELNRLPSRIDEHEGCKSPESMSYWSQKKKYKAWKWEDISRPRRLIIDLDDSFSSENTE